ncbi:MAG: TonB-dependent receptor [Bacteroidota bacterium]
MNYIKKYALFFLFTVFGSIGLLAQSGTVTGKVLDADGAEMIGANIVVKGTTMGTAVDIDGSYSIEVPDLQNTILVITYTGYQPQEITVNGRTTIDITLELATNMVDEIVVVGYGTQRKSDLTGSISSVKAEEITRIATGNVAQALQGKVAGVQITPSSGRPGAGAVVRIRGIGTFNDASPLFVVDGMLLDDIDFLNPNDIASIEVLKDASATAIYGSRGANGVIIVTTKKGTVSKDATITVEAYQGWQEVTDQIDLVNGAQYAQLVNELSINEGGSERYPDPASFGEGTDWQDVIFETAPMTNIQIAANGGNENIVYNVSANYFKQDGIIRKFDFERVTVRLNSEYKLKPTVSIGHNISLVHTNRTNGPGVLNTALRSAPISPIFEDDGVTFSPSTAETSSTGNAEASFFYNNNTDFSYRAVGNIYLDIGFLKNFKFRSSFGGDISQSQGKNFVPVFEVSAIQQNEDSRLTVVESRTRNWLWENTLTYDKAWANHRINALVGITAQEFDFEQLSGSRLNFIGEDEEFFFLNAGDETTATANNFADLWSLASYLFRVNYTAFDKYLLTLSFRADGSSKFGENNRYGFFPSAALGWNVTNEPFLQDQELISRLKIRGSWGVVGNEKIGTFRYSPLVTSNLNVIFGLNESIGEVQNGAAVLNLANPDLQWEETSQANIGFEIGLFDNKLTAEVDYYIRTTDQILAEIPIPDFIGSENNPIVNAAKMRNQGIDLNLGWRETKGDFTYAINIVGSTVNNEVLSLGGGREEIFGGGLGFGGWLGTRTVVGQPIGSFWGWQVEGVFQNEEELGSLPTRGTESGPGDLRFADINGLDENGNLTGQPDGQITDADRTFLGNPIPDLIYGINLSAEYKGFDFTVEFNGQSGNEVFNSKVAARFGLYNFETRFLDRWTGEGTSNFEPRVTNSGHNYIPSNRFIEDGSFLRLRNLTIGYTLPNSILQKTGLRNFRVYVGGTNLVTWTDYTGFQPEIGGGNPFATGIDSGIFPINRAYTAGFNVSF